MKNNLAVYIHFGFCLSKCPYCDFMSKKIPLDLDFDVWVQQYIKALDFYLPFVQGRTITSIYFGGGTPSLLPDSFVNKIIKYLQCNYDVKENVEITMEGNPSSISLDKLKKWRDVGINRFSLGVQSFEDNVLHFLGRRHNAVDAKRALESVLEVFDNSSLDMIYAYPFHNVDDWRRQLVEALSFGVKHMSLYQLTIEPPSLFAKQKMQSISDETAALLYKLTIDITHKAGFEAYEVSNFAKKGFPSRHNLAYWRYEDYLGIGPSAHGRISFEGKKIATKQYQNPFIWFRKENKNSVFTVLSSFEQKEERILMGLRTSEGIQSELCNQNGLKNLKNMGWIYITEDNKVVVYPQKRLLLNAIIESLL